VKKTPVEIQNVNSPVDPERKLSDLLFGLISIFYFFGAVRFAADMLLWHDELSSLCGAKLPTIAELKAFLATGADVQPAPFHFLESLMLRLSFLSEELRMRLPSIFGIWLAMLCGYLYFRRLGSSLVGLLVALMIIVCWTFHYALEARPYGLAFGVFAAIFYLWTGTLRGPLKFYRILLLSVLAAAFTSLHYLAILLLVPIALAEIGYPPRITRERIPVYVAFSFAVFPILFSLDVILAVRELRLVHHSPSSIFIALNFYDRLFGGGLFVMLFSLLGAFAAVYLRKSERRSRSVETEVLHPGRREIFALVIIAAFPILFFPFFKLIGGFTARYALPTAIGLFLLIALIIRRVTIEHRGARVIPLLLLSLFAVKKLVWDSRDASAEQSRHAIDRRINQLRIRGDGQIVYADFLKFLPDRHYGARSDLVVSVYDREAALRITGWNVLDAGAEGFSKFCYGGIQSFDQFTASHRRFRLLGSTENGWVVTLLLERGAKLELLQAVEGIPVYQVTLAERASTASAKSAAGSN